MNNVFKCGSCDIGPCVSNEALRCGNGNALWSSTTKYAITEVTEPVYIVQIPETCKTVDAWIVTALYMNNLNGLAITKEFTGKNSQGTYCFSDIPEYCLKQKPAEPTREKLQIKLDSICEYVKNTDKVSVGASNIIYDLAGM